MASLDSLKPRGLLVVFGNASGAVKAFDLGLLASKGSLYVTRPTVMSYTASDAELAEAAKDVIEIVKSGKVKIPVNQRYALADAARAHRDLESRATTGTTIFIP
jgi:NADPH2:quinone reductase